MKPQICQFCAVEFVPKNKHQHYCCDEHREQDQINHPPQTDADWVELSPRRDENRGEMRVRHQVL